MKMLRLFNLKLYKKLKKKFYYFYCLAKKLIILSSTIVYIMQIMQLNINIKFIIGMKFLTIIYLFYDNLNSFIGILIYFQHLYFIKYFLEKL